jgi:spermidine synthase
MTGEHPTNEDLIGEQLVSDRPTGGRLEGQLEARAGDGERHAGEGWFAEPPFAGYQQRYRLRARLHHQVTDLQTLDVLDLEPVGRALVLDATLQTSLGDDFTYHEPLVHVPLCSHPDPRRVLIVGGGDGGALRHVLLHGSVEQAVEVEIDRAVVDVSRRYLPEVSGGAYDDPRARLVIADGAAFAARTSERFDVVLVDSTDPVGPAAVLVSAEFLAAVRRLLTPGGIMAMQSGSPLTQPREWLATTRAVRAAFPIARTYLGMVPIYPGVQWSWVAGSEGLDPTAIDEAAVGERMERLTGPLHIYNPSWHRAAFALPTWMRRLLTLDRDPTTADLQLAGHPLPGVLAGRGA